MYNIDTTAKVLASLTEEQWKEILTNVLKDKPTQAKKDSYSPKSNEVVYLKTTELMRKMGVPTHIKGYEYLREAISLVYNEGSHIYYTSDKLNLDIAKKFNSTPSRVERTIRYALELTLTEGVPEVIEEVFGVQRCNLKPRIAISAIVEYIKLHE